MKQQQAFARLQALDRHLVMLEHIGAALQWDQETVLSARAVEERSVQLGWLAQQSHAVASGEEMGQLLSALDEKSAESDFEKALIRVRRKEYERKRRMPSDLVRAITEQSSKAHQSWVEARKASDFKLFSKDFATMVDLVREKASCLADEGDSLYDALLCEFEEGMTTAEVSSLFDSIKKPLSDMVQTYAAKEVDASFLYQSYAIEGQQAFANQVLADMGFDFTRGCAAVSVHPFTTTIAADDIRITTRYTDPSVMDSFASSVHEGGHALYEMGASSGKLKGTSLSGGASHGMHESQSRLWENMISKSPEFWQRYYPRFQEIFPSQTADVSLERFVKAVNKVGKTCIRVNADEMSYSLHIFLRFGLEQDILARRIAIDDIPQAWDEQFAILFGFKPPTVAQGVLQDVHWSSGDFGYFPTYALGNLYGAQIWDHMQGSLGLQPNDVEGISSYLKSSIYEKGALQTGRLTAQSVTGKALDATVYTSYLENKFSRLFG
ncbi:carboxypeptidase M32 [Sphaerochaeta globosa]|uniref:Metal-dependent carboxypeptidase n=1 Tax=Sphaerochaeta globosa (strain ATCC BAA-1886 / DSM 22777 / Buddy) TaxID=158189 RepID=F0RS88_SPHGB|nr:carboxypeptidase M32 [Sphaerochaeta globosa]ADY14693.1 Carboxypeptidase Taq [Sphaerochaeta globosa str. Buddy]